MDHGGQFEIKGRVMSHVPVDGVDLCDNLPNTEHVTAQSGNVNDTKTLTQNQSEEAGGGRLIQKNSFSNNGKNEEDDEGREGYSEEEEDFDEMMKDDEEEESSSLIHCQSPDTPMTDSSYSETGSLLETPYPFSPGTSPEPTSPVIPVISPESSYPISPVDFSRSDVKVDPDVSVAFTTGPLKSNPLTTTSDTKATSPTEPECITEAKSTDSAVVHVTSSTEPVCNHEPDTSHAGPITSTAETFTVTSLNTSISSTTMCAPTTARASTTGPTSTGTESTFTTGPMTSSCLSVSTCSPGSIPSPALLKALEQLAQRGDDSHLPHYLHQIAEAFVLHRDYQRALWCIHLERLYHQRLLDNLNILQQQWESQCERTSSDLATQHLDPLTHICQTHSRPSGCDAACSSLDFLRPTEESDSLPSCTSDQHRENPESEVEKRDGPCGCQLTEEQSSDREGGVGHTTSTKGNGLHPSTAGEMDQPKPAEQQGGDLGLAEEKEAKREEEQGDVEEAAEALEMEDEGEEEDEKCKGRDAALCQTALPVDTLVSGTEVEVQQLHQEARAEEKRHEDNQVTTETCLHQEAHLTQEAHVEQTGQEEEEEEEEEEEYEYEVEPADIIREAASLDDMAKLITVEDMSPASGLVSILKKRSVRVHTVTLSSSSEPQQEKSTAKRRVRFKVPEDDDQEVGSSDSCLLLFLLCLVTVVISVGGTALYCALGDAHSSVCQDFSRNADFYIGQIQRGMAHIQQWFSPGL
ncbi:consortin [Solea senegalensis]|uniref:Consortin n=1 Tax=Solea senegalensis TaxID=28829 RepID=A0AAV6Q583_SOLSE|nr:consortin isoform X2 [Solea senegalensis]KAG7483299.1 consortin [Solea senegalensis]